MEYREVTKMDEFDLNSAVARYFEQAARNEKAVADLKAAQKEERETLKEEIDVGHRNAYTYALQEHNNIEYAQVLRLEVEKRLAE